MAIDNVHLFFANNEDKKIVIIDEVNKDTGLKEKYYCPICNSEVLARQGDHNSWCFAHIDKNKCTNETRIHWWVKNKLIEKGTKFTIKADTEKEYICEDIIVEKTYDINEKSYTPDLTVITTTGETIFFEMEYSNKKRAEDYMSVWLDLSNIVVEVDTKDLIRLAGNKLPVFKALFDGEKCTEVKKGNTYYNTIGKYKEKLKKNGEYEKRNARIKKLDWLWRDVVRYKHDEVTIEEIYNLLNTIDEDEDKQIVFQILEKPRCCTIYQDYIDYKAIAMEKIVTSFIESYENGYYKAIFNVKEEVEKTRKNIKYKVILYKNIYDRVRNAKLDVLEYTINDFTNEIKRITEKAILENQYYEMVNTCICKIKDKYINKNKDMEVCLSKGFGYSYEDDIFFKNHLSGVFLRFGIRKKHIIFKTNEDYLGCKEDNFQSEVDNNWEVIVEYISKKIDEETNLFNAKKKEEEDIRYEDKSKAIKVLFDWITTQNDIENIKENENIYGKYNKEILSFEITNKKYQIYYIQKASSLSINKINEECKMSDIIPLIIFSKLYQYNYDLSENYYSKKYGHKATRQYILENNELHIKISRMRATKDKYGCYHLRNHASYNETVIHDLSESFINNEFIEFQDTTLSTFMSFLGETLVNSQDYIDYKGMIKEQLDSLNKIKKLEKVFSIDNKILNILENNKEIVINYNMNYTLNENLENVIYFMDYRDKEFIVYNNFINENDDIIDKFKKENKDKFIFIKIPSEYYSEKVDIYFTKTDDAYLIQNKINTPNYKFNNYFNQNKINLTFAYINGSYTFLQRYDFMNVVKELDVIFTTIEGIKKEFVERFYKENNKKIYSLIPITDDLVNKKIQALLYPILYILNKKPNDELNLILNIEFTKEDNKLKPWLIKDFIMSLNKLGVTNIENIK